MLTGLIDLGYFGKSEHKTTIKGKGVGWCQKNRGTVVLNSYDAMLGFLHKF